MSYPPPTSLRIADQAQTFQLMMDHREQSCIEQFCKIMGEFVKRRDWQREEESQNVGVLRGGLPRWFS